jgi:large subunit ribosomal protein L13
MATQVKRSKIKYDLKSKVFGRAASEIALILSGKRKVEYYPHLDVGDYVIAYNLDNLKFKGTTKLQNKKYYRHSGYPGSIKEISLEDFRAKDPKKLFTKAVYRMLPKNKLRKEMIKRLSLHLKEI